MKLFTSLFVVLAAIGSVMALPTSDLVARNVTATLDYPGTCNNENLSQQDMFKAANNLYPGVECIVIVDSAHFAQVGNVHVSGRKWGNGNVDRVDCGLVAGAVNSIAVQCGNRGGSTGATRGDNTIVVHVASHWV
ncbi:hypothetical protein BT63DRAFT_452001 [Microthyrium microscopicum]|uniref:Ecp2 effector protein domain-containing protein n=1 Tax=Microthyrium microscopicum TaxID=703497 RepID=A0A6A6UNS6_9PEZI|nr:hypothetical protein BT63DRAFT_452001 [Microthyrium microscopicum]